MQRTSIRTRVDLFLRCVAGKKATAFFDGLLVLFCVIFSLLTALEITKKFFLVSVLQSIRFAADFISAYRLSNLFSFFSAFPVRKGLVVNFWAYVFRFGKIRRLLPAEKWRKLTVHIYFESLREPGGRKGTGQVPLRSDPFLVSAFENSHWLQ